ncbi:hypothetical protein [Novosphingobium taihuense]|uniref:Uncharacterized protein n=1 Tax=Novosphingobium taihuense TaxID=260085 RepID=A0A7W7A7S9_9SPHN|nr:hypothetical protein [Novosphingobium taihuense]MBB4612009.1 hypothetical protein [Novosphingobium taihuense]TWH88638.1 hypothetical protein IQ25_00761 [Novosphingobium taihuense]
MTVSFAPHLLAIAAMTVLAGCGSEPNASASSPAPDKAAAKPFHTPLPTSEPVPAPSDPAPVASATSESGSYAPQDDCAREPEWPTFRKALAGAIKSRDAQAMAKLAAPDISLDYGGGNGTAELVKRLNDPQSKLWQELDAILPLGCAVQGGLAAMPWVFWNAPEDIDSYSAMLVLGDAAPLLDKAGGKPVTNAGWTIVGIDPMDFDTGAKTTRVTTHDGRKGWIETRKLRSLLDYRLIAEPKDGQWQITAFIAGD